MKLKVLGTRGEIEPSAPYHSHQSGVLLDDFILLDCGEKEFLKYNPQYIFLTHLHPDHAFFVRHPKEKYCIATKIFAPETFDPISINVLKEKIKIKGYEITPIPTHHSTKVLSQAYLIQKGDEKILYTGDMIWINKEYHHLLKGLKLIVTEASYIRKGGVVRQDKTTHQIFGHNGIPDLIHLFKPFTNHILFVHFGSWFYKGAKESRIKIKSLAEENNINLIVGYDGLEIDSLEL